MSTAESILAASGAVADVFEPLDPETAERARLEAIQDVEVARLDLDIRNTAESKLNQDFKQLGREETTLLYNIGSEISDNAGEETDAIERAIETLGRIRLRKAIKTEAHRINTEEKKPRAQAALLHAQANLKFAAAEKIDADRWARLRQHAGALNALTASEGDTVIAPDRFQQESAIADELRMGAVRLRDQALEIEKRLREGRG